MGGAFLLTLTFKGGVSDVGKNIISFENLTSEFFGKKFIKKPGKVIVKIGAPITGESAKELTENAYLWIKNSYREIS